MGGAVEIGRGRGIYEGRVSLVVEKEIFVQSVVLVDVHSMRFTLTMMLPEEVLRPKIA